MTYGLHRDGIQMVAYKDHTDHTDDIRIIRMVYR